LRLSGRGRGSSTEQDRADEAADVLCMLLLYCRHHGIDPEAAVARKWLSWLEPA
jgi:NTP pyrophosphatase (non-canonical NTP hydrolase)